MFNPVQYLADFRWYVTTANVSSTEFDPVAQADPNRVYLAITNIGSVVLRLQPPPHQTLNEYQYLVAPGTTLEIWWERHGPLVTLQWDGYKPTFEPGQNIVITNLQWFAPPGD